MPAGRARELHAHLPGNGPHRALIDKRHAAAADHVPTEHTVDGVSRGVGVGGKKDQIHGIGGGAVQSVNVLVKLGSYRRRFAAGSRRESNRPKEQPEHDQAQPQRTGEPP